MYIERKNYVYREFSLMGLSVFWYNKSIKKFPSKSFSLCLSNNTPKGAYSYVYYNRIKDKAGVYLE